MVKRVNRRQVKSKKKKGLSSRVIKQYAVKYGGYKKQADVSKSDISRIKFYHQEAGLTRVTAKSIKGALRIIKPVKRGRKAVSDKPDISPELYVKQEYWSLSKTGDWLKTFIPATDRRVWFKSRSILGRGVYLQAGRIYDYHDTFKEFVDSCNALMEKHNGDSGHTILVYANPDTLSKRNPRKRWEIEIQVVDELTGKEVFVGKGSGKEIPSEESETKQGQAPEAKPVSEGLDIQREITKQKELEVRKIELEITKVNRELLLEAMKLYSSGKISKAEFDEWKSLLV